MRTRFAPSPTGDLHVGSAWTALAAWALARAASGTYVVRIEDLDPPRVVPGSAAKILDDLAWLGLAWDETAPAQSTRAAAYEAAIAELGARGLVYACDCSRSEIARIASAPHAGEETVYPGTCRDADPGREMKRPPAIRLRVPDDDHVAFDDGVMGAFAQHLRRDVGDFVLRRGDGVHAYQLAVVVDDMAMAATDIVRGADLLASTPRQLLLARLLGATRVPRYFHVPLVVAADGTRLSKRTRGSSVRALREAGVRPEAILGVLAHGLGITDSPEPRDAPAIAEAARARPPHWPREPFPIPSAWASLA